MRTKFCYGQLLPLFYLKFHQIKTFFISVSNTQFDYITEFQLFYNVTS